MTEDTTPDFDEFEEVTTKLASSVRTMPSFDLRSKVLAAATDRRQPTSQYQPMVSAIDAYKAMVTLLDEQLDMADWTLRPLAHFDTRELLIHLMTVDSVAIASIENRAQLTIDIEAETEIAIRARSERSAADIREEWHANAQCLALTVDTVTDDTTINYLGIPLTIAQVVTDRAFETWLHAQDVRKANGREIEPPASPVLARMTDLGARMLPLVLSDTPNATTARVVVPGSGGGTWLVPFASDLAGEPQATITIDALSFCLLIGGSIEPNEVRAEIEGDHNLAALLLERAPRLSRL